MLGIKTKRPRDVNTFRAAAILYGDWGTSKAYVIGLAFALAAYSSFWYILAVSVLSALVGINYILICKYYPSGGGVYASVRDRSKVLSLIGAFFLIADYLVTAALSAVSSFHYLGVPFPAHWAMGAIFFIGLLNYLGPKHSGSLAIVVSLATFVVVVLLGILSIPHLSQAIHATKDITVPPRIAWENFVGIIVALSGIEAIANTTGVMKLNSGSTTKDPIVTQTSTPAILMVMIEVCFFTTLFGLAMNALPGLQIDNGDVNAPGFPGVRDAMLRYMGQEFAGHLFGEHAGYIFGWIVSLVFCILLLSAVNTAIVGLSSLLFVISRDREAPLAFQKINRFGVPVYSLMFATLVPIIVIFFVHDIASLADLYAVGFVGAIATNLGATSTNFKLDMSRGERIFMFLTFLLMAAIEITLLIDKPHARGFVLTIVAIGLILRALVKEQSEKLKEKRKPARLLSSTDLPMVGDNPILCVTNSHNKTLEYAINESKLHKQPLYILYVREQKVITEADQARTWLDDDDASALFDYLIEHYCHKLPISLLYSVSDSKASTIMDTVKEKKVLQVILESSRRTTLYSWIRGNLVREVAKKLPNDIELVVIY